MNARQMKKCLKKRINRLESDNDLMRRIILDSPTMQELYDLYNKPLFITHTTMQFQEYRSKRFLPPITPKPKTDVLDKIRAEIEQMNNIDYVEPVTVDEVLQIIDKYKAESEDKE